jgi:hypothetical protein
VIGFPYLNVLFWRIAIFCFLATGKILAQSNVNGFPFGATYKDLDMVRYERDTTAAAVVLQEFGETFLNEDYRTVSRFHIKWKVLKQAGMKAGDVDLVLRKPRKMAAERLRYVRASSFNLNGPSMEESKFDLDNILVNKVTKWSEVRSIRIPNVRVGSVVEYEYEIESPLFGFPDWYFQSEWPKMMSEYRATIPRHYEYNITLRGELELTSMKDEASTLCPHNGECKSTTFIMRNIPAFVEESMMPAKRDYLSRIDFSLARVRSSSFTYHIAGSWGDIDRELLEDDWFGGPLNLGADIANAAVEYKSIKAIGSDTLALARGIHAFVRDWYAWDSNNSFYCSDLLKTFSSKKGDSGDINMTLIALLRYAGYKVDPVILSTIDHGQPADIQPSLADFNYVLGRIAIGQSTYLVDAVDDLAPFGVIPRYCFNGDGRLISPSGSGWHPIKTNERDRLITNLNIKLDAQGKIRAEAEMIYYGYSALEKRTELKKLSEEEYVAKVTSNFYHSVDSIRFVDKEELPKPLVEKWSFSSEAVTAGPADRMQFNPFLVGRSSFNPFKSDSRIYPVWIGLPQERKTLVTIAYPENMQAVSLPVNVGFSLPNNGGKYLMAAQDVEGKIIVTTLLQLTKPQYAPDEYHALRELIGAVLQSESVDLIFSSKTK